MQPLKVLLKMMTQQHPLVCIEYNNIYTCVVSDSAKCYTGHNIRVSFGGLRTHTQLSGYKQ